jgi:taurine dioxygenase
MDEFVVEPLTPTFGAEIRGLDASASLSSETRRSLADAYLEHRVLLFRDQILDAKTLATFGRVWGTPRIDAFTEKNVPGFLEVSQVGNVGEMLDRDEYRNGASFWHTDCAAQANPDASTMLYCMQAPHSGGETILADMQGAYEALDDTTKAELDAVVVHHCYSGTRAIIGGRESWEGELEPFDEATESNLPAPAIRPLVRAHSVTKRKGLYSPAGSIFHVESMPEEKAHELIRRVKLHAIQDAFCYRHRYRVGDLLMWDNTATMHCATPVGRVSESGPRLLYRVAPLGLPPALRK